MRCILNDRRSSVIPAWNLALAFYNVGTIWAHEIDIFRSWSLVNAEDFHTLQSAHRSKLPYWIFAPVGFGLLGGILLIWNHPAGSPFWAIYSALVCQILALVLTAIFWGRWQARLALDALGSQSPYLSNILTTHWIRTLLISAYAGFLLIAAVAAFGG
jgi:hypothetical protein